MRLREALDGVPDHRSSQGRRHPLGAVLSLAVCAMLCGARSLYAIAQWGRDHGARRRGGTGFPFGENAMRSHLAPGVQRLGCGGLRGGVAGMGERQRGGPWGQWCRWMGRPCGGFTGRRYPGCIWCRHTPPTAGRC